LGENTLHLPILFFDHVLTARLAGPIAIWTPRANPARRSAAVHSLDQDHRRLLQLRDLRPAAIILGGAALCVLHHALDIGLVQVGAGDL
jgi:hypothetical protein